MSVEGLLAGVGIIRAFCIKVGSAVAKRVKSGIWLALNIDRAAYIDRIKAKQIKEAEKTVALKNTLEAKRELQNTKDTNAKLRESIKRVGSRN